MGIIQHTLSLRVAVNNMKLSLIAMQTLVLHLTGFVACFQVNKLVKEKAPSVPDASNKFSLSGPLFVETYWESWVFKDYPQDYCAEMKDVPASPIGSTSGANIVNIAFADYTGGLNGIECNISNVVAGIEAVHQAGGLVKVAY